LIFRTRGVLGFLRPPVCRSSAFPINQSINQSIRTHLYSAKCRERIRSEFVARDSQTNGRGWL